MKSIIAFCLLCTLALNGFSLSKLESSYIKARQSANDTAKVNALNFLGKYHVNVDQDSSRFYVERAMILAQYLDYRNGIATANLTKGILENDLGNFPEALDLITDACREAEEIKDYPLLASCKLNLGNCYIYAQDYDKAIQIYKEGLEICERHNLLNTQANLYTSIGLGLRKKDDLDSALIYYNKVLEMQLSTLHDSVGIAAVYNNLASIYFTKDDIKRSEEYLLKSYELNKQMHNMRYQLMNLGNLGAVTGTLGGDLSKSMQYYNQAIEMGKNMGAKDALEGFYFSMSEIYYNHNKFKEAYEHITIGLLYKDSVMNDKKQAQILEISEEFQTQKIQDSLRINRQELKLSHTNEEAATLKAAKTTWQLFGSIVLLLFILIVLFMVFRSSKNQKKINELLQGKNNEISEQKLLIEEKNGELTDSINYAKRIQSALLPSAGYLKKILGDHFLLFTPKDIVSGDFYWVKQKDNRHYFAVADCTGHGVPGAMVSMLGYETIEKVSAGDISDAATFVSKVNEALVNSLSSKSEEKNTTENQVKDGMDLSLCIVTEKQKLSYCGANNVCYIIRKNGPEIPSSTEMVTIIPGEKYSIIELKPTKRPVGFYHAEHEFKSVELQLIKGDMFYLFSDGYADQFGGDKGKKMKSSTFREVLLKSADKNMLEQLKNLREHLESWQGNFNQLDDITVLGVKVE